MRQYEEFARLQNGVLAQFTTQREILFAGQPFQAPESYLRNAELYEEGQTGNYNMLDGRLNNEPPVRPDLTDGQTDEEIRELVPEAKPSLMDRLKADKPEHEARQMIPPVPEVPPISSKIVFFIFCSTFLIVPLSIDFFFAVCFGCCLLSC